MMHSNFRLALMGVSLLGVLGTCDAAQAQVPSVAGSPNTMSAVQGSTTGLGDSHRFATRAAASAHCETDTIVWSSGPDLTYTLPNTSDYGKGHGFYACKSEADDAGFRPGS